MTETAARLATLLGARYRIERELGRSLYRARIDRTRPLVVHQPEGVLAFESTATGAAEEIDWDFFPDGTMVIPQPVGASAAAADSAAAQQTPTRFVVVLNWFAELKARVAAGKK